MFNREYPTFLTTATMASNYRASQINQLVECAVCLERFSQKRVPKILTCSHTLCIQCAEGVAAGEQLRCPVCRGRTKVPEADVSKLQTNLLALQIAELNPVGKCEVCQSKGENMECFHCEQQLCGRCLDKHTQETETELNELLTQFQQVTTGITAFKQKIQTNIQRAKDDAQTQVENTEHTFTILEAKLKEHKDAVIAEVNKNIKQIQDGWEKVNDKLAPYFTRMTSLSTRIQESMPNVSKSVSKGDIDNITVEGPELISAFRESLHSYTLEISRVHVDRQVEALQRKVDKWGPIIKEHVITVKYIAPLAYETKKSKPPPPPPHKAGKPQRTGGLHQTFDDPADLSNDELKSLRQKYETELTSLKQQLDQEKSQGGATEGDSEGSDQDQGEWAYEDSGSEGDGQGTRVRKEVTVLEGTLPDIVLPPFVSSFEQDLNKLCEGLDSEAQRELLLGLKERIIDTHQSDLSTLQLNHQSFKEQNAALVAALKNIHETELDNQKTQLNEEYQQTLEQLQTEFEELEARAGLTPGEMEARLRAEFDVEREQLDATIRAQCEEERDEEVAQMRAYFEQQVNDSEQSFMEELEHMKNKYEQKFQEAKALLEGTAGQLHQVDTHGLKMSTPEDLDCEVGSLMTMEGDTVALVGELQQQIDTYKSQMESFKNESEELHEQEVQMLKEEFGRQLDDLKHEQDSQATPLVQHN